VRRFGSFITAVKLNTTLLHREFMSKVTLKGFILVPASDLEVVKQALVMHKQLTLEEPGCITFKVVENKKDPLRFDVYEEFTSQSAYEQHQHRVRDSDWGKVTVNAGRHYQIFK